MGQQSCCAVKGTNNQQITHQICKNEDKENKVDDVEISMNKKSVVKENQEKRIKMQRFYGAKNSIVTKTMTKQINIPELQEKINNLPNVIEENSQENSKQMVAKNFNTKQFIQFKTKQIYQTIESKLLTN